MRNEQVLDNEALKPGFLDPIDPCYFAVLYKGNILVREIDGFTYGKLERDRIDEFWLVYPKFKSILKVKLEPGQHLIFRKDRTLNMGAKKPSNTVYIVGYYEVLDGERKFNLWHCHQNGQVEVSNSANDVTLYAIEKQIEK